MNFRQFAFKNVIRNKRLYIAYFLSSMFTVMVFFVFAMFAFHPIFMSGSIRWEALYGMSIAGGIIYIFSFFFVLYSMSSFLKSRKREFGLLMMQGMSTRQIRLMVFLENLLIGFIATISGILIGLVFSKAILLLAENVLVIDEQLDFYFPLLAIGVTFVSFLVLFFFISVFVSFILRTNKLIDLIKDDKRSKGEPKASVALSFIALILLIGGYGTALYVKGTGVILAMLPVILVVIVGTYLLFTQLSVFIIRRLKKNKRIFWRKTNMLLFSDLSFRMKDNARTFFMVAIISTVAFSAIGTLYGFQSYVNKGLNGLTPYTFMHHSTTDDEGDRNEEIDVIEQNLEKYDITTSQESIAMSYFNQNNERILIVDASTYNRMADLLGADKVTLADDEVIGVKDSDKILGSDNNAGQLKNTPVKLADGASVTPSKMIESNVLPNLYAYYIVGDTIYDQLPRPESREYVTAWSADDDSNQHDAIIDASAAITDDIGNMNFDSFDYTAYQLNKLFGPILFIGLFIGIVFFVSAGSFLYFRLYSDLDADKEKFKNIAKMGLTQKEMKKVVNRQTGLLFFTPIIVALVHGAIALTALSHFFEFNLVYESTLVLGAFLLIQIIYFGIVRYFYTKQIQHVM
ncbi:MAG TPA: ABC transporter permease [Virgibacillus sp.]|nr:ABC transporter permease [Virgibacillus sp.]